MKIFDYFYENYVENGLGYFYDLGSTILNALLVFAFYLTVPIWIIPYFVWKHRKKK